MDSSPHYHRHIGPFSATMLIAGSMIGSGIFIVPAEMVRLGGSGTFLLAAWVLTTLLTLLGAHSYGELAGMFPEAGGQFVYLKNAYGPLVGFLYGWTMFTIIETGCIAAVAMAFGKFLPFAGETRYLLGPLEVPAFEALPGILLGPYHLGLTPARLAAILVILVLSAVNACGARLGVLIQNVFTVAKLGSLLALVAVGLLAAAPAHGVPSSLPAEVPAALPFLGALLVAQSGSLFSADAWNAVTFIASEVREPRRTIPLALLAGPAAVLGLYLLANAAYLRVLGPGGIATAPGDRVGTAALHALFGAPGDTFMTLAILVSTFGCANGVIMAGSRLYQSMAAAGLFFPAAARLNRRNVPAAALAIQACWACLLTLTGNFSQLVEFSISAALLFYLLTVLGVFVLRWRDPHRERPVGIIAYPLPPALYAAGTLAVLGTLLRYRPSFTWPGMALVLLGVPVYFAIFQRGRTGTPC
jgi:APA family basic amino acid/polyamine antiporter